MGSQKIKIVFFADSHIGFDDPIRPRVQRPRRGDDFYANYLRILQFARDEQADLIVHGGDVFFRTRVAPAMIEKTYRPLVETANAGIPILIVPGNHESGRLPPHLWLSHPKIHVFTKPQSILLKLKSMPVAFSGFPFMRKFGLNGLVQIQACGSQHHKTAHHFLCLHQAFAGAQVGVQNYTFRTDKDSMSPQKLPQHFTAVLSGHIHRAQTLRAHGKGQPPHPPVIYPGSIERTSFAEREEQKQFLMIEIDPQQSRAAFKLHSIPLPSRPMCLIDYAAQSASKPVALAQIKTLISHLPENAHIRVKVLGPHAPILNTQLQAAELRALASSKNQIIDLALPRPFPTANKPAKHTKDQIHKLAL